MIQNTKDKLRYLVDCRDKEEAMERLKALGIEISESELEEIKQSLNKNSGHSSCLGMEQLEKVAGGMKRMRQYEGEEKKKKKKEEQTLGGGIPPVGIKDLGDSSQNIGAKVEEESHPEKLDDLPMELDSAAETPAQVPAVSPEERSSNEESDVQKTESDEVVAVVPESKGDGVENEGIHHEKPGDLAMESVEEDHAPNDEEVLFHIIKKVLPDSNDVHVQSVLGNKELQSALDEAVSADYDESNLGPECKYEWCYTAIGKAGADYIKARSNFDKLLTSINDAEVRSAVNGALPAYGEACRNIKGNFSDIKDEKIRSAVEKIWSEFACDWLPIKKTCSAYGEACLDIEKNFSAIKDEKIRSVVEEAWSDVKKAWSVYDEALFAKDDACVRSVLENKELQSALKKVLPGIENEEAQPALYEVLRTIVHIKVRKFAKAKARCVAAPKILDEVAAAVEAACGAVFEMMYKTASKISDAPACGVVPAPTPEKIRRQKFIDEIKTTANPKELLYKALQTTDQARERKNLIINAMSHIIRKDVAQGNELATAATELIELALTIDDDIGGVLRLTVYCLYAAETLEDVATSFDKEKLLKDLNRQAEWCREGLSSSPEYQNFVAKIDGRNGADANTPTPTQISAESSL